MQTRIAGLAVGLLAAIVLPVTSAAAEEKPPAVDPALARIIAGEHRSPANKARDAHRHPAETLSFFGLRPDSTVVEIWPGQGWYTEIIAPYVRESGTYYAAGWDPESEVEFFRKAVQAYKDRLAGQPELYDRVKFTVLAPPDKLEIAPPGSADLVLTFRNIHNWMANGNEEAAFRAMYAALKPGGILGVVEHRADPASPRDPKAKSGYVHEDYAIELAQKAGFVLEGRSDINANPRDTRDYPKGVWTLPPTFAEKDQDRARYEAIGESDRFTLKFRKPR